MAIRGIGKRGIKVHATRKVRLEYIRKGLRHRLKFQLGRVHVGHGKPQRIGRFGGEVQVARPEAHLFRRKFHLLVTVPVDKGDHAVVPRLKARERKVSGAVGARHVQRRFLQQQRFLADFLGSRVAVLFKIMSGVAVLAQQEKADTRVFLLAGHRLVHEHAARHRQGVDNRTRRENHLERFRKRVPVQVLDTTRKRNRVGRSRIEHSTRRKLKRIPAHLETQFLVDRRRNRNSAARNRRIDPLIKFEPHQKFVRMVRRLRGRIHRRHARRELVFGATARSYLCRTRHKEQRGKRHAAKSCENRTVFRTQELHQSIMWIILPRRPQRMRNGRRHQVNGFFRANASSSFSNEK